METRFAIDARKSRLTTSQMELVLGSMLGDGYLMPTTSGFCFRVNHGLQQKSYVDWKFKQLKNFVRSSPRVSGKCYYFRTITHPEFSDLRNLFYSGDCKIVPIEFLLEFFSEFSLAVWMMDDGAAEGRQMRINTQCFSLEENELLSGLLRAKFGINTTLNRDKNRFRLRIAQTSMEHTMKLVVPFVVPDMLYKFPL